MSPISWKSVEHAVSTKLAYSARVLAEPWRYDLDKLESAVAAAEELRSSGRKIGSEQLANASWVVHRFGEAVVAVGRAYTHVRAGKHREGWIALVDGEDALNALHGFESLSPVALPVDWLLQHVLQMQKPFPYQLFASTGLKIRKQVCSICGSPVSPFTDCGHELGGLYMGERCGAVVLDAELMEASLVRHPADKRCVMLGSSEGGIVRDHHNYRAVDHLFANLVGPFARFQVTVSTRHYPPTKFQSLSADRLCPCRSGETYGRCCKGKKRIPVEHLDMVFEIPAPGARVIKDELL